MTILQTAVSWPHGMIYGQVGSLCPSLQIVTSKQNGSRSYTALGRRDRTSENDASGPRCDHKTVYILVDS